MKNSEIKKENVKQIGRYFKTGFKEAVIDLLILILGFLAAFGLFVAYKNFERNNTRNQLIPSAKSAYENKEYSKSLNLFLDADKEFTNNPEIKKYLGDLYFRKKNYNEASNYYKQAYDLNKEFSVEEISNYGNALINIGKTEEAILLWQDKELLPTDKYTLAKYYLQKGDIETYKIILESIKQYFEPLLYLQVFNADVNITNSNIAVLENATRISTDSIDFNTFKIQITEAKKQFDAGKQDYSELIQLTAFSNINACVFLDSRINNLKSTFEKQKIPVFQVEFIEGKCANQKGNPDAAIALIQKAIAADKSNIEYREELAVSYFLKKDIENLKKIYNDIFLIKKNSSLINNYAGFLYKLGLKSEAKSLYKEAFSQAESQEQKVLYAKVITQIGFLDDKDFSVCTESNIIENLRDSVLDEYFLKSHCKIYNGEFVQGFENNRQDIRVQYIEALSKKNKLEIYRLLDQDSEAFITAYYSAIGEKILQK